MKKAILLSTVFSLAAAGAFAQAVNVHELGQRKAGLNVPSFELSAKHVQKLDLKDMKKSTLNDNFSASPRSISNGLYYTIPQGSMYTTDNEEGNGYYVNHLVLSPSADAVFTNMTTTNKKSTKWYISTSSAQTYADADYNLDLTGFFSCFNGSVYPTPTLKYGSSRTYQLGETGDYFSAKGPGYMYCDSIAPHAFWDSRVDGTYALTNALDSYYCFGTGSFNGTDDSGSSYSYTSIGAMQLYDAPASPLYVENMFFYGYTMSDAPLTGDGKMTMTVYKTNVTDEGQISLGDEIATLTCSASDASKKWDGQQTAYGYVSGWNYMFLPEKPFTIDGSFAVKVDGFADEGVDVLMPGAFVSDIDSVSNYASAYMIFDIQGTEYPVQMYQNPVVLPLAFNSCFDYVDALSSVELSSGTTVENANVVRISDDGQTCSTDGADDASDLGGVYLRTVFPFYDSEGEAWYTTTSALPDWITDITADDVTSTSDGYTYFTGATHLTFEAKPLGTETGRGAAIFFKGKGVTSTTPVYVLQGNATVETGIEKVVVDLDNNTLNENAPIYNLNGQRVTKDAKGVLIQGGKKFINK